MKSRKNETILAKIREFVGDHPIPVILGSLALGGAASAGIDRFTSASEGPSRQTFPAENIGQWKAPYPVVLSTDKITKGSAFPVVRPGERVHVHAKNMTKNKVEAFFSADGIVQDPYMHVIKPGQEYDFTVTEPQETGYHAVNSIVDGRTGDIVIVDVENQKS